MKDTSAQNVNNTPTGSILDPMQSVVPTPEPTNPVSAGSAEPASGTTPVSDRPAFMTVEEPSATAPATVPPVVTQQTDSPSSGTSFVVSESSNRSGGGNAKKLATIFGIIMLVGATGAGVFLAGRNQLNQASAWDCSKYNFSVSPEGAVSVINGSTRNEPSQKANVKISNNQVASFDVPALNPGQSQKLGDVSVPSDSGFTWEVLGTVDCRDGGSYQGESTATASCSAIKVFTTSWQPLSANDLAALKAGDEVRFTVMGIATSGTIDKARFSINGVQRAEVTTKRPGTEEFYDEYTIPEGITTFNVTSQVHHQQSNQWY